MRSRVNFLLGHDENYVRLYYMGQCIWIAQQPAIYQILAGWLAVGCQQYRPSEFMFTGLYLPQCNRWQATTADATLLVRQRLERGIQRPQLVCINWLPSYDNWALQEKHEFNWLVQQGQKAGVVQWVVVPKLPSRPHPDMTHIGWNGRNHTIGSITPKILYLHNGLEPP